MGQTAKTRSDARLRACVIPALSSAGVEDPHTLSRTLIAVLRREDAAAPGARTFGPGDDVLSAYDLDGDVWDRWTDDPTDPMRGSWRMREYDPENQDSAAAGVYLTPHLLTSYGPLTHLEIPWQGGPRAEDGVESDRSAGR